MESERIIIFQHLAKCGGMTLLSHLQEYYEENKTFSTFGADFTYPIPAHIIKKILDSHFVHDHHIYTSTLTLNDPKFCRISFFREPLSRLISHWQHVSRVEDHDLGSYPTEFIETRKIARTGFKNFLLAIKNRNPYTKYIADFYANYLLDHDIALKNRYVESPSNVDIDECKRAFNSALSQYAVVGLFEDYDMSLLILSHFLNIPPPIKLQKHNQKITSQSHPQLDPETFALAEEVIALDKYIYERVKEIYTAQKETFLKSIPDHQDPHTFVQQHYEQFILKTPLATRVNINMHQALKGAGWHTRETIGNKVWRWTGPGTQAYLDLRLFRSKPLKFTLNFLGTYHTQSFTLPKVHIKILVDGKQVKNINRVALFLRLIPIILHNRLFAKFTNNKKSLAIRGIIAPSDKDYFTRFTIDTGATIKPRGNDQRSLGLMVESLIIEP